MQTWLVHMRQPAELFRALGACGFLTFQLVVGGNALVALAHPVLLIELGMKFFALAAEKSDLGTTLQAMYFLTIAATGYGLTTYLGWRGLLERKTPKKAWVLVYTPLHWIMLSFAAWWAALELIYAPFRWNKTEHGVEMVHRLLKLEHHLSDQIRRGELPQIWGTPRDISVSPPRPLRAAS
jgi:hypothetical protein